MRLRLKGALRLMSVENLSTGIEASASGESLNSGDPAVHPAARHMHRMVMENRPVDPGSIQGSHRPISFVRIKHRTRADDTLCKTEY